VLLIIEVSDTTLNKDIQIKLPMYANAGIPEVWSIDIKNKQLLHFTDNKGGKYQQENTVSGVDQLTSAQRSGKGSAWGVTILIKGFQHLFNLSLFFSSTFVL
jgi:hypothetical protein